MSRCRMVLSAIGERDAATAVRRGVRDRFAAKWLAEFEDLLDRVDRGDTHTLEAVDELCRKARELRQRIDRAELAK